ncbi:MAG: hypothetical protein PUJ53_01245, partial [Campylobacteraceae bacterium]|nr:hypothetical protein [Campylobacteraceae bacterium]
MIKTLKISLIALISLFIVSCASVPSKTFLMLDDSKGFAGNISKAPDENRAPDRISLLKDEKEQTPILTSSNNQDGFDP